MYCVHTAAARPYNVSLAKFPSMQRVNSDKILPACKEYEGHPINRANFLII